MENNGEKVLWFLGGAVIGAALALLYAPKSGEETRRYLRDKSEEGRDALAETGRKVVERGRELYQRGREIAEEAASDLKERANKLVES